MNAKRVRPLVAGLAVIAAALTAWGPASVPTAVHAAESAPAEASSLPSSSSTAEASAAPPGSSFDPGYIISDAVFFNSGVMSLGQVQSFLSASVPTCASGYTCLKSYTQSTWTRAADAYCRTYEGRSNESAASIIHRVAQACGINPQVLLVLLQKEQGLVTSTAPSESRYRSATGYGCPDTAPCDAQFYGFFNQVYKAAWQFKRYAAGGFTYRVGANSILYHPNAACGRGTVQIRNQATANLYNYTPYQPNGAALANLYGTGDGCSSYGNRNFWRIFWDWFGSPIDAHAPYGSFDVFRYSAQGVEIGGWAVDPDVDTPVSLHVYINGVFRSQISADVYHDAAAGVPSGRNAFSRTFALGSGRNEICVWALNQGPGSVAQIGRCETVPGDGSPIGSFEGAMGTANGIVVNGWVFDPDSSGGGRFHAYVDGAFVAEYGASKPRADVAATYGRANSGFDVVIPASPGAHEVCLWAPNSGAGNVVPVGSCRRVTVDGSPFGVIESVTNAPEGVRVTGWVIDPDTSSAVELHAYVDGTFVGSRSANAARPDIGARFPSSGQNHGLDTVVPVSSGQHVLCLWALNTGTGGVSRIGDCQIVQLGGSPVGAFTGVTSSPEGMRLTGWAIDPDTAGPVEIHVYSNDVRRLVFAADATTQTVPAAWSPFGAAHGIDRSVALPEGSNRICLWAVNVGVGEVKPIGDCRTVNVDRSPFGEFDIVASGPTSATVAGWVIDADTSGPVTVHVYVDGSYRTAVTAGESVSGLGALYGYGDLHGYRAELPLSIGRHSICLWPVNVGAGHVRQLRQCRTVDIGGSPVGAFDGLEARAGGFSATGWVIDPDTVSPSPIHLYVNGRFETSVTANVENAAVGEQYPLYGPAHGFSISVDRPPGVYQVCLWAPNIGAGEVKQIGSCRSVTVTA